MARGFLLIGVTPLAILGTLYLLYQSSEQKREVRHATRPRDISEQLLILARVGQNDLIYDLECGDGTLVLVAAREYGARSVCVDAYPLRIAEVHARAQADHVENLITLKLQDWRTLDVSPATVIVLFSPMQWDRSLRGHITQQAHLGTRIVAWLRNFGSWEPSRVLMFQGIQDRHKVPIMLWMADGKHRPQEVAEAPAASIPVFEWP